MVKIHALRFSALTNDEGTISRSIPKDTKAARIAVAWEDSVAPMLAPAEIKAGFLRLALWVT